MAESGAVQATRVVPLMRYRDLPNAISWLSEAFGFDAHYTATDDDGELIYAQMTYGHGMVMLGPVRESDFDDLLSQPDEIGGTETQSCYLVVEDIEEHFKRAKEAGAEIALDVQRDDTGGRAYSCRDCEGHLWNFGTFNPWQSATGGSTALTPIKPGFQAGPISMARSAAAVFAGIAIAGVAIGVYTRHQTPEDRISNIRVVEPDDAVGKDVGVVPASAPARVVSALRSKLQQERSARREAETLLATARRDLAQQQQKSQVAVSTTRRVTEELKEARGAEQAALATLERLRAQHVNEMRVATTSVSDLQQLIEDERNAKDEALKAIEAIKYELVRERQLRQQAEREANVALRSREKDSAKPRKATPVTKAPPKVTTSTPAKLPVKPVPAKADPPAKKVTAVEPPSTPKASEKPAVTEAPKEKAEPKVTKKNTKKRARRTVTKKTVKKKAPKKTSGGISKGWPYNTW